MKVVERNLYDLKNYENNPRNNQEAIPKVKASIKKYGYKVPIVIDSNNVIVAGHTRHAALREINEEDGLFSVVSCILADDLTEEQIKEFRIVDNSVASIATWDMTSLKFELETLPNFDIIDFGGIPELTVEEIQIQEEQKLQVDQDKIYIKIAGDKIELSEQEYNDWVQYVIGTYNMSIVDFVKQKLELDPNDRTYEEVEL